MGCNDDSSEWRKTKNDKNDRKLARVAFSLFIFTERHINCKGKLRARASVDVYTIAIASLRMRWRVYRRLVQRKALLAELDED